MRFSILLLFFYINSSLGQALYLYADSIRIKYYIPELVYAVVSSDSIIEIQCMGVIGQYKYNVWMVLDNINTKYGWNWRKYVNTKYGWNLRI